MLYQAKLHWTTVAPPPALLLLLALLFLALSFTPVEFEVRAVVRELELPSVLHSPFSVLFVLFVVFALTAELGAYLTYATSEFALTDRRALAKVGWVQRWSLEVLLTKVESIGVNQGIGGRMFDYGTVTVTGTGGTTTTFKGIASPFEFYKRMEAQIADLREDAQRSETQTRTPG